MGLVQFGVLKSYHTLRTFPTKVDPVNDIFWTSVLAHRVSPMTPALSRDDVTTFSTPAGTPARSASYGIKHLIETTRIFELVNFNKLVYVGD